MGIRAKVRRVPVIEMHVGFEINDLSPPLGICYNEQEQALRAEAFRDQSQHVPAGTPVVAEACASPDAVDRVRITVAGEGQLHLRGPLEGINAIARMVHEIDQPVGQVKIGMHVVQFRH